MEVVKIMSKKPIYVEVSETVQEALRKLVQHNIRHLPVMRDNELIGMLSDRDVRDYALPIDYDEGAMTDHHARLDVPVSEVMSGGVIAVNPESDLDEVIDLMIEYKVSAVPVVDSDGTGLRGIVSYIDILEEAKGKL